MGRGERHVTPAAGLDLATVARSTLRLPDVRRQAGRAAAGYSVIVSVRIRLLLIAWLVLALPLQSLAAAARLHCAAGHAPARAAHAAVESHETQAGHDHHADHGHHGDPAGAPHAAVSPEAASTELPGSCSACALCCHALALPAPEWRLGGAAPDVPAAGPPGRPLPPFFTGRLERPPRPAA